MNFYRETMNSKNLSDILNLPPELRNTDVEIIILPAKKDSKIDDLLLASESSLDFWDNDIDDEVWNDV